MSNPISLPAQKVTARLVRAALACIIAGICGAALHLVLPASIALRSLIEALGIVLAGIGIGAGIVLLLLAALTSLFGDIETEDPDQTS